MGRRRFTAHDHNGSNARLTVVYDRNSDDLLVGIFRDQRPGEPLHGLPDAVVVEMVRTTSRINDAPTL